MAIIRTNLRTRFRISLIRLLQSRTHSRSTQKNWRKALTPDIRQKVFATWRQSIDANAHDFADLILRCPDRDRIAQLEVSVFMQAYMNGYMAARGWVDPNLALQSAFILGRRLRDELRGLGMTVDGLSANLGTTIDQTLVSIVRLGLEASKR